MKLLFQKTVSLPNLALEPSGAPFIGKYSGLSDGIPVDISLAGTKPVVEAIQIVSTILTTTTDTRQFVGDYLFNAFLLKTNLTPFRYYQNTDAHAFAFSGLFPRLEIPVQAQNDTLTKIEFDNFVAVTNRTAIVVPVDFTITFEVTYRE